MASGQCENYNVVIHEMAYKIDILDGEANGCPSLYRYMAPISGTGTSASPQKI